MTHTTSVSGMTCFAWKQEIYSENNSNVRRNDFAQAGALGVMTIVAGLSYVADFFWLIYKRAFVEEEEYYDY